MKKMSDCELNNTEENHGGDCFDNFLRTQFKQAQPYLMDENFTANVIAKLPEHKKLSRLHERLIILIPLIIISVLVLSQFSLVAFVIKAWTWLFVVDVTNFVKVAASLAIISFGFIGIWFAKQCRIL